MSSQCWDLIHILRIVTCFIKARYLKTVAEAYLLKLYWKMFFKKCSFCCTWTSLGFFSVVSWQLANQTLWVRKDRWICLWKVSFRKKSSKLTGDCNVIIVTCCLRISLLEKVVLRMNSVPWVLTSTLPFLWCFHDRLFQNSVSLSLKKNNKPKL